MSIHRAKTEWQRNGMPFEPAKYSRAHRIEFESLQLAGNAAKENIPPGAPHGPGADPEQLFVASLSACHMLWFVSLAATRKLIVNRYVDDAEGVLERNSEGRMAMTRVTLRPAVEFAADPGDRRAAVAACTRASFGRTRHDAQNHRNPGRTGRCRPLAQPARGAQRVQRNDDRRAQRRLRRAGAGSGGARGGACGPRQGVLRRRRSELDEENGRAGFR